MPAPKFTIAEQEQLILQAAAECIEESSLTDFKMSAIAKSAGLSMGSVYKHIQSKEDVLVALAVKVEEGAYSIISEILALPYSLPAKMVAINLVSPDVMYSHSFGSQLIHLLNNEDILAKASEKWLVKFFKSSDKFGDKFYSEVDKAIATGELQCSEDEKEELTEDLLMSHWAINIGFPEAIYHKYSAAKLVGEEAEMPYPLALNHSIIRCTTRLMNTFPWRKKVDMQELELLDQIITSRGLK